MIKDFPVSSLETHIHNIAGIRPSDKEFRRHIVKHLFLIVVKAFYRLVP